MPQSPSKLAPWDLTQFSQSPPAAMFYLPESHQWSDISSLSKVILILGKARSCRMPNLGCRGNESLGWFDVSPKKPCMRRDAWASVLWWWSYQSPAAHSCSLLNHLSSFRRGMFKFNTKLDADSLLYSLNYFECNSHTVHMLSQQCLLSPLTNTVKSALFIYVQSSPLSLAARLHRCHANVPIILTVAGLFLDRIHIHSFSTGDIYLAYLDVHCIQDSDASVPFRVGTLGPHTVLPIAISCPVVFSWISSTVWNLFLFKGYFGFGKNWKSQGTKSGL